MKIRHLLLILAASAGFGSIKAMITGLGAGIKKNAVRPMPMMIKKRSIGSVAHIKRPTADMSQNTSILSYTKKAVQDGLKNVKDLINCTTVNYIKDNGKATIEHHLQELTRPFDEVEFNGTAPKATLAEKILNKNLEIPYRSKTKEFQSSGTHPFVRKEQYEKLKKKIKNDEIAFQYVDLKSDRESFIEQMAKEGKARYAIIPQYIKGHSSLTVVFFRPNNNKVIFKIDSSREIRVFNTNDELVTIWQPLQKTLSEQQNGVADQIDMNCTLYTINFVDASIQLLQNQKIVDRIEKYIDDGALYEANATFYNELKKRLPMYFQHSAYYSDHYIMKSPEQILRYHLQKRWDLGSEFVRQKFEKINSSSEEM